MSRIVKTTLQLKGDSEPQQHYALVFDDVTDPGSFIVYRNALTTASKALLSSEDAAGMFNDEVFWLLQLSEFISTALDFELYFKGGENG